MNLYITNREVPPLSGVVMPAKYMGNKLSHLTLASQVWDTVFVDIDETIPEGSLRFLPKKCTRIRVCCPAKPTMHELHLLVDLYPELDGRLRKAFMKGEDFRGVLPEVWEYGKED